MNGSASTSVEDTRRRLPGGALRTDTLAAHRALDERERLLSGVFETSPVAFVVMDAQANVEWWNGAAERLLGWSASEAIGRNLIEMTAPEHLRAEMVAGLGEWASNRDARLQSDPVTLAAVHRDGRPLVLEVSVGELAWNDGKKVHAFVHDVTEREEVKDALLASEERFRSAFVNAPIGNVLTDLRKPDFGRLIAANPAAQAMLGYSEEELRSLSFRDITHPHDAARDVEMLPPLLRGEVDRIQYEKRYLRADGTVLWVSLSATVVRERDGSPIHSVTQLVDITERRAQAEELERVHRAMHHQALHDGLTGLPNRSLLMDRLTAALGRGRRRAAVAVGFCDIDHFKAINDTHGHHVGDEVLAEVARRLQAVVRTEDTVARLGGDEFIILLDHLASPADAVTVMDRARASVTAPIVVDGVTVRTSISGGLVIAPGGSDPDAVLREADRALYVAKDQGRGRIEITELPPQRVDPAS